MKSPTKIHYFDYNATHPPNFSILERAWDSYKNEFFNPSGASRFSLGNQGKIEVARKYFSNLSGYPMRGIVFSSTGTEANHLLIAALKLKFPDTTAMYTSPFEHASFYSALNMHGIKPVLLKTDKTGLVSVDELRKLMEYLPLPVGIIYAGNETGVIQPMEEIGALAREFSVPFVTDAMQSFGKMIMNFESVDGFSCSGHKIGAGPGCGLTGIRENLETKDWGFMRGGNQENGHRAGTENLPSILSFQFATQSKLENLQTKVDRNLNFRKKIEQELKNLGCEIVAENSPRLSHTIFCLIPIPELDFFIMGLEERGVIISTGSSCKSRARNASTALTAMGYSSEDALRAVRISFGDGTEEEDIEALITGFKELIKQL
ncbi:cysteine desulfurase family protein [Leptospira sp. GIMC2001]|uniref:cysteine desulfurase family protein n=1 Tax=Leptospira sp. GIMC2001 TaxID=1513297 RepID=UPI0023491A99|nr:aminotransferase class V-fold PLP-dependent enzyme [Leptospira sp. GIMC2001]WCL48319.1 aminotransferase class V-fold PLP-dependent enzyme [Leptospira sp. GIMC2001]